MYVGMWVWKNGQKYVIFWLVDQSISQKHGKNEWMNEFQNVASAAKIVLTSEALEAGFLENNAALGKILRIGLGQIWTNHTNEE